MNTSESEFIKLINENQGLIHKVCIMYCHNEEYRKDLFQDILLQLWRSFPNFKENPNYPHGFIVLL